MLNARLEEEETAIELLLEHDQNGDGTGQTIISGRCILANR